MKMVCLICIKKKKKSISWSPGKVVQKYCWVAGFSISKCFRNISCHHPSNSMCDVIRDGKSELSFRLCNYLKQILTYFLTELVLWLPNLVDCFLLPMYNQSWQLLSDQGICTGRTLADCKILTQPFSHSPSSAGQGKKIRCKSLWVEIKMGRLITNYYQWAKQTQFNSEFSLLPFKNRIGQWEIKTKLEAALWDGEWGLQSVCNRSSLPLLPHTVPCSRVGPSHGLQSFRINLLQVGLSMGCSSFRKYSAASVRGPPQAAVWRFALT